MKALQHLKFLFRQRRLDFSDPQFEPFNVFRPEDAALEEEDLPAGEELRQALDRASEDPAALDTMMDKVSIYIRDPNVE